MQANQQQSKVSGLEVVFPRPEVTDRQAYAPAITIAPSLDLVFFSGITPYPPEVDPWKPGSFVIPPDPAERSKLATANLDALLKAAGATWEHIVFNVNYSAPGGGAIVFAERWGTWRPCSTSLRVLDTGVPGVTVMNQITATAPHRPAAGNGTVPGIEVIFPRTGMTLADVPAAPGIRITNAVDLVYFPGVTAHPLGVNPWSPGSATVPTDLAAQEAAVADNLDRQLKSAGLTWQHVILLTVVGEVSSLSLFQDRFGTWKPCRTTRAVRTGIPGARLQADIVAVAPGA
jgi:enamine deaminase RidA (YjgF/YER057c/UK114 family)